MKHIKLFEGFYSDRISEVEKELANHMKNDLANWINEFKDELDDVEFVDAMMSKNSVIVGYLYIFFNKKSPTIEELEFIEKTYNLMRNSLNLDYKISITYESTHASGEYGIKLDFKNKNSLIKNIKEIEIEFKGE